MDPTIIIGVVALVFILLVLVAYTSSRRQPGKIKTTESQPKEEKAVKKPEPVKQEPEPVKAQRQETVKATETEAKPTEAMEVEDLDELSGIGEKYRALLRAAGVRSVSSLSKQNPETLLTKLTETNEKNEIVKRLPSAKIVEDWVERAKESV